MSGENPILLLKSVITHSIAPRHTQTLTRGRKKKTLTFNSLVGKPAGCCQALPVLPSHPSPHQEGIADDSPAPQEMDGGVPTSGWGGGGRGGRGYPCQGSDRALGQPRTQSNTHKLSKIVVVAFLGLFIFYTQLLQSNLYLGPSVGK